MDSFCGFFQVSGLFCFLGLLLYFTCLVVEQERVLNSLACAEELQAPACAVSRGARAREDILGR